MIKWNEVTWYSRLIAIIFFIGILPVLCFYMGSRYGEVKSQANIPNIQVVASSAQNVVSTTTVSTIDTSDWKTYRDEKRRFEFKYPPTYVIRSENENGVEIYDTGFKLSPNTDQISPNITIKYFTEYNKNWSQVLLKHLPSDAVAIAHLEKNPKLFQSHNLDSKVRFIVSGELPDYLGYAFHQDTNAVLIYSTGYVGDSPKVQYSFDVILSTFKFLPN